MNSLLIDPVSAFVSEKRSRSDVRSVDLHAFFLTALAAQNADQLKGVMLRTLGAVGIEFLQLSTYRRSQFATVIWSDLIEGDLDADAARVSDSICCRAMTSGVPERWDCNDSDIAEPDDGWRNVLRANGIRAGLTSAIHAANDWCYIFHFGAQQDVSLHVGRGGSGVFSTIGFVASQRLAAWQQARVSLADSPLSLRELEVIRWCKDGKSYPEIAQILGISTKTVEFHIANAMRKLGVNQKVSAILEAVRRGLIDI